MGVAIYYAATRARPLSEDERTTIARLIADHDPERFLPAGGEPFRLWDGGLDEGEILAGATGLPLDDPGDFVDAVEHWAGLVGEMRRAVPDATWRVHVDDHDLTWDEESQSYSTKAP